MSAVRTNSNRRGRARSAVASPYSRPTKKSTWSLGGLLSWLNPLRSHSPERSPTPEEERSESPEVSELEPQMTPAAKLSIRGRAIQNGLDINERENIEAATSNSRLPQISQEFSNHVPPVTPKTPMRFDMHHIGEERSPAKNLETVSAFLSEKAGKALSDIEVEGLISLIQKSTPEKHEPFRFQSSVPSTPARIGNSHAPNASPRRTLSKNPNGVYRWEGGGSARPSKTRNRYSSPAFGASRCTPERIVLKESSTVGESPMADTKRRRVVDKNGASVSEPSGSSQTDSSQSSQSVPFPPISTPTRPTNGTLSLLRTSALQRPTTPAIPSPLRQTWSDSPAAQKDTTLSQPQTKPTKTANFMAELIKEVTPPKKPDVSNPYQTASPVGKVAPPRRSGRRTRAVGRPAVPGRDEKNESAEPVKTKKETEKISTKDYSPQAIIEATLPKGSKRSRPPAHLDRPISSDAVESSVSEKLESDIEMDEASGEESQRLGKRTKPSINGHGPPPGRETRTPPKPESTTEQLDVEMQGPSSKAKSPNNPTVPSLSPLSPNTARTPFGSFKPTSIPKEPSKLRYSYQPEGRNPTGALDNSAAEVKSPAPAIDTIPEPPSGTDEMDSTDNKVDSSSTSKVTNDGGANNQPKPVDAKEYSRTMPVSSLPTFTFTMSGTSVFPNDAEHVKAREYVKTLPKSALPSFSFDVITAKSETVANTRSVPPASLPTSTAEPPKAFDWSAAGIKPPSAPSGGGWSCSTCMLMNPADATTQCTFCETPR